MGWAAPRIEVVADADPADLQVRLAGPDDLVGDAMGALRGAAALGFHGSIGEMMLVSDDGVPTMVLGVGQPVSLGRTGMRRVGDTLARQRTRRSVAVHGLVPLAGDDVPDLIEAFVEGVVGGAYQFDRYRTTATDDVPVEVIRIIDDSSADLVEPITAGLRVGSAVALTRDLVNESASVLTPTAFADHAGAIARETGLDIDVLDEADLARERCGGILGIGRGSAEPPRLVTLSTRTPNPSVRVALVGKGITFDAGGLFLKRPESIVTMKGDMAGAAAILAAIALAPIVAPRVEVRAYLALAENLPGERAIKPGDVVTARNGKTIDVNDTDAEGRVVLADALSMAGEAGLDVILDVATLTGAKSHALGPTYAASFATDDDLARRVDVAGQRAGEPVWRLPLVEAYRSRMDSPIADLRVYDPVPHCPDAIHAALFLREFVPPGTAWVHLDIGGCEIAPRDGDVKEGMATGFGARLLIEFLRGYARD
jgi:leucyl aminopeptidase